MRIGVPKEIKTHEYRVGLTPSSVRELIYRGHEVLVETDAGQVIGLEDEDYRKAGARVAGTPGEVFATSELIVKVSGVHFAVEIANWDEMIAHMDNLGIFYSKMQRQAPGAETSWGSRDYTGNHYTYIRDPDGNTIELVHHPLGIEDSAGKKVDLQHDADSLTWTKRLEFDPAG